MGGGSKPCPTGFILLSQFLTILGTEFIGTFRAFQGGVGVIPKPFGIDQHAQFPHDPCDHRQAEQGKSVKAAHKDHGGEHHQMVPVEDAAGGAAAGLHHQPERAPDQYTDEIAHVEDHADHKQTNFPDDAREIQKSDHRQQDAPQGKDFISGLGGGGNIFLQGLNVYFFTNGAKTVRKEFLRTQGQAVFDGNDLKDHVRHPDQPKQMKHGKSGKEPESLQNIKDLRTNKARKPAKEQDHGSAHQFPYVSFPRFGHKRTPVGENFVNRGKFHHIVTQFVRLCQRCFEVLKDLDCPSVKQEEVRGLPPVAMRVRNYGFFPPSLRQKSSSKSAI